MSKTVVEIQRTWGRYVKGDVAGFEPAQAERLTGSKPPIAKLFKGETPQRAASAGSADAADIAKRMAALDEREKQLAAREAELELAAAAKPSSDAAGAPPKQGSK
ncbi:hypothetical protein [Pontibaca salina]|uniref:Uncharacterized protein n=1 Tax=Pontibaca salina TaxID=2795731 RepID=A0A934M060_9RHOB|nr:hypothetical protein [Pontibaca salina]MBI6628331.1 hypothetical protein [Pontibaca salina]